MSKAIRRIYKNYGRQLYEEHPRHFKSIKRDGQYGDYLHDIGI